MERVEDRTAQTMRELQELLRMVASGVPMQRPWAVKYTECRDGLLASPVRPRLPGFLGQCGSIDRFRDFITLYHPNPQSRITFIDTAFASSWGELPYNRGFPTGAEVNAAG
jgi:hypothetical protein